MSLKVYMSGKLFIALCCGIFIVSYANATTWDEPWADKVIKESSSFIRGTVIDNDDEKGAHVLIQRTLAGEMLPDTIFISNFYALRLCSTSGGHGPEFHLEPGGQYYFFITQNDKKEYCIATPTAGYDYIDADIVGATFRHTYHKAGVPVPVYENTMKAFFNHYHGLNYDAGYIDSLVNIYLQKQPAGFDEEEINIFFMQHVALESLYHLNRAVPLDKLLPFLNDANFHNQVSAARAMHSIDSDMNREQLLQVLSDTSKADFVKVICVWSLTDVGAAGYKQRLVALAATASKEDAGFGGNIMDPRVCTRFPNVKEALETLLKSL